MAITINGSGTITGASTLATAIASPTLTTPTVTQINSSAVSTPTIFADSGGTAIGTLCRAWVNFNGSTGSIRGSFNVSSVTVNSTGYFTIALTNALPNINYSVVGGMSATSGTGQTNTFQPFTNPSTGGTVAPTTSSFVCSSFNGGGTAAVYACVSVFN